MENRRGYIWIGRTMKVSNIEDVDVEADREVIYIPSSSPVDKVVNNDNGFTQEGGKRENEDLLSTPGRGQQ